MLKKIAHIFNGLFLALIGYVLASDIMSNEELFKFFNHDIPNGVVRFIASIIVAFLLGAIGYVITPLIMRYIKKTVENAEIELEKIPPSKIVTGSVGLIIGLIIAYLISTLYRYFDLGIVNIILSIATYIFFGYIGVNIAIKRIVPSFKLPDGFKIPNFSTSSKSSSKKQKYAKPKVLDTSVIIDGRISDICKTGFIEGALVIPEFVLEELRHIADSSDALKRNRGRRGLDILKIIQNDINMEVVITDKDFDDVAEVDIKLIKLAQLMDGMVVTNDFNLNKVSALHGVPVLNINELSNAIKPIVLPGEEMVVQIVKEGKENNQGVAYLDDGTMIVIEGGVKFLNQTRKVTVTSILQTSAGRMIFARP